MRWLKIIIILWCHIIIEHGMLIKLTTLFKLWSDSLNGKHRYEVQRSQNMDDTLFLYQMKKKYNNNNGLNDKWKHI